MIEEPVEQKPKAIEIGGFDLDGMMDDNEEEEDNQEADLNANS